MTIFDVNRVYHAVNDSTNAKNGSYVLSRGYLYTVYTHRHKDNDPEELRDANLGPSCRFQRFGPPWPQCLKGKDGPVESHRGRIRPHSEF